jgi:protein TonB
MKYARSARRPWHEDHFMLFLVLALGIHAVLFIGVQFGITLNPAPRLADTLDVVLVRWRSEDEPDKADFLAQSNQQGGGESNETERPSRPVSGELPIQAQGQDTQQSMQQIPLETLPEREVIAVESPQAAPFELNLMEQPETETPSAATLMQQSMSMASLQPQVSREQKGDSKLPIRKVISANTKEYEFASYMSAWVAKVERVGNLNYPVELRQKRLHGNLVLSVGIYPDGSIESIEVKRTSGIPAVDKAAVDIVTLSAPYAPLPDNIRDKVDILHITRTWRFGSQFGAD